MIVSFLFFIIEQTKKQQLQLKPEYNNKTRYSFDINNRPYKDLEK